MKRYRNRLYYYKHRFQETKDPKYKNEIEELREKIEEHKSMIEHERKELKRVIEKLGCFDEDLEYIMKRQDELIFYREEYPDEINYGYKWVGRYAKRLIEEKLKSEEMIYL